MNKFSWNHRIFLFLFILWSVKYLSIKFLPKILNKDWDRVKMNLVQPYLYLWKPEHLEMNRPMVTVLNGTCQDGALAKFFEFFSSPIFEFRPGDYQTDDNPNAWTFLLITELYLIRSWNKMINGCKMSCEMSRESVAKDWEWVRTVHPQSSAVECLEDWWRIQKFQFELVIRDFFW